MKIINQYYKIKSFDPEELIMDVESAARVCYKSEDKITKGSAEKLITNLINNGHEAMLEHASISVRFITDRGVTHEMVRHRLCAVAQESTRYCNYANDKFGNELTFIKPVFWNFDVEIYKVWLRAMQFSENTYLAMIKMGAKPQEARSVLPNSLKTEIVITANLREWRHIFYLRSAPAAHPQMRDLMIKLENQLIEMLPCVFGNKKININESTLTKVLKEFIPNDGVVSQAEIIEGIVERLFP